MRPREYDRIDTFLKDAGNFKPLKREHEDFLSRRTMFGSPRVSRKAAEKQAFHATGLVIKYAGKFSGPYATFEDLLQEGMLGALRAAEKYDYRKQHNRFISYAKFWISSNIQRYVALAAKPVSFPAATCSHLKAVSMAMGPLPTRGIEAEREIAAEIGAKHSSYVGAAIVFNSGHMRLDTHPEFSRRTNPTTIKEMLPDETLSPETIEAPMDAARATEAILGRLTERERRLVEARFGIGCDSPMTLDETGEIIGVTRERARQIIRAGLYRVLTESSADEMAEFGALIGLSRDQVIDYAGEQIEATERREAMRRETKKKYDELNPDANRDAGRRFRAKNGAKVRVKS